MEYMVSLVNMSYFSPVKNKILQIAKLKSEIMNDIFKGFIVETNDPDSIRRINGVKSVFNVPEAVTLENGCDNYFTYTNAEGPCTKNSSQYQFAKTLVLGNRCIDNLTYRGAGTILVVWDKPIPSFSLFDSDEFKDSAGNSRVIDMNPMVPVSRDQQGNIIQVANYTGQASCTTTGANCHAIQVASIAAGNISGIANHSVIYYMSLANQPSNCVQAIFKLAADNPTTPIIVNMSFQYYILENDTGMVSYFQDIDNYIKEQKKRFPKVTFVVAAGNDGVERCSRDGIIMKKCVDAKLDVNTCINNKSSNITKCMVGIAPVDNCGSNQIVEKFVYLWPFIKNTAIYNAVGSVDTLRNTPSTFSDSGSCIMFWAPGDDVCTQFGPDNWKMTDGTSFACPIIVSLLSVIWSKRLKENITEKNVIDDLKSMIKLKENFAAEAPIPIPILNQDYLSGPPGNFNLNERLSQLATQEKKETDNMAIIVPILIVVGALFLMFSGGAFIYYRKKHSAI